jgi:hypothetical protein
VAVKRSLRAQNLVNPAGLEPDSANHRCINADWYAGFNLNYSWRIG